MTPAPQRRRVASAIGGGARGGRRPAVGARWSGVVRLFLVWLCALFSGFVVAQSVDPLRAVADRNGEISTRIAETVQAIDEPAKALADLRRERTDLEQRMRWVERRASVQALGQEFAQTLREYLRGLPTAEQAATGRQRRMELLATASDSELAVERALHRLDDLDAVSGKLLAKAQPPVSEEERPQLLRALLAALRQQRDLLQRLAAEQHKLRQTLNEAGEVADALLQEADAARQDLTRLCSGRPRRRVHERSSNSGRPFGGPSRPPTGRRLSNRCARESRASRSGRRRPC